MKLISNAANRLIPLKVNGEKQIRFQGVNKYKPTGNKANPPVKTCIDFPMDGNKVIKNLKEALN